MTARMSFTPSPRQNMYGSDATPIALTSRRPPASGVNRACIDPQHEDAFGCAVRLYHSPHRLPKGKCAYRHSPST